MNGYGFLDRLPVERKLRWMALIATTAGLLLSSAAFLTYDVVTFRAILLRRLISFSEIIGRNSSSAVLFNDSTAAERILSAMESQPAIRAVALYTPKGDLFAPWSRKNEVKDFPVAQHAPMDQLFFGPNGVELFHPIDLDGSIVSIVYLRASLAERNARLRRYGLIVLVISGVSIFFAFGVSRPMGRRISEPILTLAGVAQRVSAEKDYSVRAPSPGGGEVGLLVDTFNNMLGQIQENRRALQVAHDQLELKVEERTAELRHKEEELYQSRRMESVGRLAGGVAHDFNNLLTGIIGCSETLESEMSADNPLLVEVQEIKRAGERASGLTRQLLAFGRKQIISPKSLDLNAQVVATGKLLRRLIGEDIQILYEMKSGLRNIFADPGQIDQVVVNLVVNARDAMPKGGKIWIRTTSVSIDEDSDYADLKKGDYAMLSITDTGVGMTKEVQAQIFEPFFTTKDQGKGTGLGLATVYGIVKQNAGSIQVYSTPNMGTTFKVFLPQEPGQEGMSSGEEPGQERKREGGGNETILLVEDEQLVSGHVARLLRRKGYEVLVAASGKEALEIMERRAKPVDMVLTDVVMPEMNGKDLIEKLRKQFPSLRVLFMSGYPAEVIARHGVLEAGISFIEKPFYSDQIAQKIREVLDA